MFIRLAFSVFFVFAAVVFAAGASQVIENSVDFENAKGIAMLGYVMYANAILWVLTAAYLPLAKRS